MNFVVLQFPASNCDQDAVHGVRVMGHSARLVWHKEASLGDADAVIVPGGFSYGDYLRCGAIARFSPVMQAVKQFAENGGLVLGICNGFQVLTEAGLLARRAHPQSRSAISLRTHFPENRHERFAVHEPDSRGQIAPRPDCPRRRLLFRRRTQRSRSLKANNQILWQYCDASGNLTDAANPNGALQNIAGICNETRNVAGLMPHPERACEPLLGSADGKLIFESMIHALTKPVGEGGVNMADAAKRLVSARPLGARPIKRISLRGLKRSRSLAIKRSTWMSTGQLPRTKLGSPELLQAAMTLVG